MFLKMSHVAVIVNNLDKSLEMWDKKFGMKPLCTQVLPEEGVKSSFLVVGSNAIELVQPLKLDDMTNALAKRLKTNGEGVFVVGMLVDDIEKTGRELSQKGVTLVQRPVMPTIPWLPKKIRWLVHPKDTNGVLIELMEANTEVPPFITPY